MDVSMSHACAQPGEYAEHQEKAGGKRHGRLLVQET